MTRALIVTSKALSDETRDYPLPNTHYSLLILDTLPPDRYFYPMEHTRKDALMQMFARWAGQQAEGLVTLPGSGSDRVYYRLYGGGRTALGSWNPDNKENVAFYTFSRHFRAQNIRVPEVYAENLSEGLFLQQDLGDTTLLGELLARKRAQGTFPMDILPLYQDALSSLASMQVQGAKGLDWSVCTPVESFDRTGMLWDLNYFKYCFLRGSGVEYDESLLEKNFGALADLLCASESGFFLHRDFQARNLMLHQGHVWIIDHQGGRKGALAYDVASLLFQARAELPREVRDSLLDFYIGRVNELTPVDEAGFKNAFKGFVLIRALQTLGAYGFRGLYEGKTHFIESIPPALTNLGWLAMHHWPDGPLDHLRGICLSLSQAEKFQSVSQRFSAPEKLKVRINSFSYKRGWPADPSGNGGGFVFDCRALHNPGRYEEYKPLSGLDEPVQHFLLHHSRVTDFLRDVYRTVEPSVEQYLERGFTDLMISFGCTGGQHRSVFCAEQAAAHIRKKYGVQVDLVHRETEYWGKQ